MFLKTRIELTKEFYKAQIEKRTETIISLNVRKKKKNCHEEQQLLMKSSDAHDM